MSQLPELTGRRALPALALGLLIAVPASASATERLTFGDRGPNVITRPGQYVLRRSVTMAGDGPAVVIKANNVTLDLDGYSLSGPGGKTSVGILVEGQHNVRIRNGHVASFGIGVRIVDSRGVDVHDLVITGEDQPAAPPEVGILAVNSRGLRITENTVSRTFLGIFVRGGGSGANTIKSNTVAGDQNGQLGICYNPAMGADPATDGPQGDVVTGNHVSRFNVGIQASPASRGNVFADNYVAAFETGVDERTPGSNVFTDNQVVMITK
jgi:parallel beta-helix repeat protein